MAAQWADFPDADLGLYDTTVSKMLDGVWAEATNIQLIADPDPLIGSAGVVLRVGINSVGSGTLRKVLTGNRTTVGMSARVWVDNLPTQNDRRPAPFVFRDVSNNVICAVLINTTGALEIVTGNGFVNDVAVTASPVITASAWTHLSVKVVFGAGATSEVSIEREGVPVMDETGLDFEYDGPCAQVSHSNLAAPSSHVTACNIKDSFIWDGLGTVNNDHPGPVSVYRRKVVADVSSGWGKSSGTEDFALLDETPPNDADYIFAGDELPAPSIMELEDLPEDVVSVRAVFLVGRMQKSDGGDCKVQMSLSPNDGSNWADGSDRAITTAATSWFDAIELSPDTGLPLTPIEFNNSWVKLNRTL